MEQMSGFEKSVTSTTDENSDIWLKQEAITRN